MFGKQPPEHDRIGLNPKGYRTPVYTLVPEPHRHVEAPPHRRRHADASLHTQTFSFHFCLLHPSLGGTAVARGLSWLGGEAMGTATGPQAASKWGASAHRTKPYKCTVKRYQVIQPPSPRRKGPAHGSTAAVPRPWLGTSLGTGWKGEYAGCPVSIG